MSLWQCDYGVSGRAQNEGTESHLITGVQCSISLDRNEAHQLTPQALCHCVDCRKITGSTYSTNVVVGGEGFQTNGKAKTFTKTADSGNPITSHFCPECGSTLWREGPTFGDMKVVKAGVLDGNKALEDATPAAELYAPERVSWVNQVPGTADKTGMP